MKMHRVVRSRFRDYPLVDLRKMNTVALSFSLDFQNEMRILFDHFEFHIDRSQPMTFTPPESTLYVTNLAKDNDTVSLYDGRTWVILPVNGEG